MYEEIPIKDLKVILHFIRDTKYEEFTLDDLENALKDVGVPSSIQSILILLEEEDILYLEGDVYYSTISSESRLEQFEKTLKDLNEEGLLLIHRKE